MNRIARIGLTITAVLTIAFAGAGGVSASAHPGNPGGNCDGYDGPTKVDTSDGSIVLAAGTLVCIKAGDSNTGTMVADGAKTLADLIMESGLLNNGGQVPTVSNYVIYDGQETEAPTSEPSSDPSSEPSTELTVEHSLTPSLDPSSGPSQPNTATTAEVARPSPAAPLLLLALLALGSGILVLATPVRVNRR